MNNQQGQQPQWLPSYGQPNQQPPQYPSQWQQPPSQSLPPQQQWQQPMPPQQEWQWQQPVYPPPQYQQLPQYQPQTPPPQMTPQKPKSRKRLWLIIGAVVVVLIVIGAIASQAGNSNQPSTTTSQATQAASTGQQPTTQPTQATTQTPTVGKPYVVNDTWTITVNTVKTSHGTEFDTPAAGNIYLVVNVTLKNTSSQVQNVSSLAMFSLKDTTGQSYNEDIAYGSDPGGGHVEPNGLARGDIAYEVPASAHSFILQFVPDFGSSDLVEWNLTI